MYLCSQLMHRHRSELLGRNPFPAERSASLSDATFKSATTAHGIFVICSSVGFVQCSMSVAVKCFNTDVKAKILVTGALSQYLRTALLNSSKELTHDLVRSVFEGICRACSIPLPSTILDSQPLEKGGLDLQGN
jgi:hypothetical protein